jgi:hypothetical protein
MNSENAAAWRAWDILMTSLIAAILSTVGLIIVTWLIGIDLSYNVTLGLYIGQFIAFTIIGLFVWFPFTFMDSDEL